MRSMNNRAVPAAERMIMIDPMIFGTEGNLFILRADGDGMRNAGINSGDWLVFDSARKAESGDIVMLTLIGNPICRRVFFEGDTIRIRRENGETPDILLNDPSYCEISAVLIGSMRNYKQEMEGMCKSDGLSDTDSP